MDWLRSPDNNGDRNKQAGAERQFKARIRQLQQRIAEAEESGKEKQVAAFGDQLRKLRKDANSQGALAPEDDDESSVAAVESDATAISVPPVPTWNVTEVIDDALFGLFTGLAARGLLDSTIVYVTGEFGRTPKINTERVGRDHYPRNMFMLLGGGGVKGGQVLGESDETASMPKGDGFSPDDVAASFYHALGIDHKQEYYTTTGRPVMIVRDGHVIPELFT